jgi:hypothetical protein
MLAFSVKTTIIIFIVNIQNLSFYGFLLENSRLGGSSKKARKIPKILGQLGKESSAHI